MNKLRSDKRLVKRKKCGLRVRIYNDSPGHMRMVLEVLVYAIGSLKDSDDLGLKDRDLRPEIFAVERAWKRWIREVKDS